MRLSVALRVFTCLLVAGLAAGCGGGGSKGKNKDFDRPQTAATSP